MMYGLCIYARSKRDQVDNFWNRVSPTSRTFSTWIPALYHANCFLPPVSLDIIIATANHLAYLMHLHIYETLVEAVAAFGPRECVSGVVALRFLGVF
jgi:hypothetical protein